MNSRKLAALRALAERPGTEAEGRVARDMLARLQPRNDAAVDHPEDERELWVAFHEMLRGQKGTTEFVDAIRRHEARRREQPSPTHWRCACGAEPAIGAKCGATLAHLAIQDSIRDRFAKGQRVFYNKWAYPLNCPGKVAAYVKLCAPNNDYPWAWLSVRFDHLKQARQVPIFSVKGWHLSHEPLPEDQAYDLAECWPPRPKQAKVEGAA